jgi:hypothetical protein
MSLRMNLPRLRTVLLAPLVLLALAWVALAIRVATLGEALPKPVAARAPPATIAILGASGTAGDGTLRIIRYSDAYRLSKPG